MSDVSDYIDTICGHLVVKDAAGVPRVWISPSATDPVIILYRRDGRPAGGFSFDGQTGGIVLTLLDPQGVPQAAVILTDDGEPLVITTDPKGNPLHVRPACEPPATIHDLASTPN